MACSRCYNSDYKLVSVCVYRVVFGHANKCREKPSTNRSSRVPALVVPDNSEYSNVI